jgi:hypothetical protein
MGRKVLKEKAKKAPLYYKKIELNQAWLIIPIILASQEWKIGRIAIPGRLQ